MFLNHTPPAAPDTAGRSARSSQGEYFTSRKEKQDTFLQNNITETLLWIAQQSENTTQNLKKKKKGSIKIPTLANVFQSSIYNN